MFSSFQLRKYFQDFFVSYPSTDWVSKFHFDCERTFLRISPSILIIHSFRNQMYRLPWELRIEGSNFTPTPSSVKQEIKVHQILILILAGSTSSCLSALPMLFLPFVIYLHQYYFHNPIHSSKTQLKVLFSP